MVTCVPVCSFRLNIGQTLVNIPFKDFHGNIVQVYLFIKQKHVGFLTPLAKLAKMSVGFLTPLCSVGFLTPLGSVGFLKPLSSVGFLTPFV
jgi:hypothetical protein